MRRVFGILMEDSSLFNNQQENALPMWFKKWKLFFVNKKDASVSIVKYNFRNAFYRRALIVFGLDPPEVQGFLFFKISRYNFR